MIKVELEMTDDFIKNIVTDKEYWTGYCESLYNILVYQPIGLHQKIIFTDNNQE